MIYAIGIEGLLKPSTRLSRRIEAGIRRFQWDLATYPRPGLEELAGLPPSRAWLRAALDASPIELPAGADLREATRAVSWARLKLDYRALLVAARAARRIHRKTTARATWAAAFPTVPPAGWANCDTPGDAALVALAHQYRDSYPRSEKTLRSIVQSAPQRRLERRVADLDPRVLAAVRLALARTGFAAWLRRPPRH